MNFETLTIEGVRKLYSKKIISFLELVEMQVNYIRDIENDILSLVNFDEELYLLKAKDLDSQPKVEGILKNIPFGVKDLIDIEGMKTEANSKSLEGNISKWWAKQTYKVAHGEGLFTHIDELMSMRMELLVHQLETHGIYLKYLEDLQEVQLLQHLQG